jgi:hypothetical protein
MRSRRYGVVAQAEGLMIIRFEERSGRLPRFHFGTSAS